MHTRDSQCTLNTENVCVECHVEHGEPCPVCGGRGFHTEQCYGGRYSTAELIDHYEALIGDAGNKSRDELLAELRGTEFDEHAYN